MDDRVPTVLIASVGTTPEPIVQAISKASEEGTLTLFLVYGRAFPGQEPDPFSVTQDIVCKAKQLGIEARVFELHEPEDLDTCIQVFRRVMTEACNLDVERVLLNFTGGTKVMAAAMVYAALSQAWGCDVTFEYVGGLRNEYGRAKEMTVMRATHTAVQEVALKVLECLRQEDYARALYLSEALPERGTVGFLKRATRLLWHWDNFHYDDATSLLRDCTTQAKVLVDNSDYSALADTLVRLGRAVGRIQLALKALRQYKDGRMESMSQDAVEGHLYILGDVIENARRRVQVSPVDCALRCYRALEVATQIGLISRSINPWCHDWNRLPQDKVSSYLEILGAQHLPKELSLGNGFTLFEVLTAPFEKDTKEELRDVMSLRNLCYLEHGYDSVSRQAAEKILGKMEKVVTAIAFSSGIKKDPLQYAEELRLKA